MIIFTESVGYSLVLFYYYLVLRLLFPSVHSPSLWISIAEFENGMAEGKVDAALNPVAAVRLTVLKDSAVWAIISEVSHSVTSHYLLSL